MKKIQLNKGVLELPDCWEDLSENQCIFVFGLLMQLFDGKITYSQCQLEMLLFFTGYKQSKSTRLRSGFIYTVLWIYYRVLRGKKDYLYIIKSDNEIQENIRFNLIRLSEQLTFAFFIKGYQINPNYYFKHNPFPSYCKVYFNRDITVETDITAKQYTDCIDIIRAYYATDKQLIKDHCLVKLASVLTRKAADKVLEMPKEVLFGLMFWFTGITKYFREDPDYSILFSKDRSESEENNKIDLGASEILLFLEKEGYSFIENKNLIDFFNAQLKALKDSVSFALASGMKIEKLSQKTKLSIVDINRLK